MSKSISVRINDELHKKIDDYAISRGLKFSQALISMLESKEVIILKEGIDILKCLNEIEYCLQNKKFLFREDERTIRKVCENVWQLLDSSTRKIAETKTDDIL